MQPPRPQRTCCGCSKTLPDAVRQLWLESPQLFAVSAPYPADFAQNPKVSIRSVSATFGVYPHFKFHYFASPCSLRCRTGGEVRIRKVSATFSRVICRKRTVAAVRSLPDEKSAYPLRIRNFSAAEVPYPQPKTTISCGYPADTCRTAVRHADTSV